jgi:hypothetical protein
MVKGQNLRKAISIVSYLFYLMVIIIFVDVLFLHYLLGFGFPRHSGQTAVERYPTPYLEFAGKPDTGVYNEYGFRGPSFKKAKPNDLKIAFFGGSTGYEGNPPIPDIVEKELEKLTGLNVFVANYSIMSSNHRQHLHAIIEYLPQFKPDIIIFYGGYNETLQSAMQDPRPGYPYNYYYRAQTSPLKKLLIENSAIIGTIEKSTGVITGLNKIRENQKPFSNDWNARIVLKYFETLMLANNAAGTIESERFGKTRFLAFYQPYKVPECFMRAHNNIRNNIRTLKYAFDVSSEFDAFGEDIYIHNDDVHVTQIGNEVMGAKIAKIIAVKLQLQKAPIEKQ